MAHYSNMSANVNDSQFGAAQNVQHMQGTDADSIPPPTTYAATTNAATTNAAPTNAALTNAAPIYATFSHWQVAFGDGSGNDGMTPYLDLNEFFFQNYDSKASYVANVNFPDVDRATAFDGLDQAQQWRSSLRKTDTDAAADPTIPRTLMAKKGLVKLLFKAFKSTGSTHDNANMTKAFKEQRHHNGQVELICWAILEGLIDRCEKGPGLVEYDVERIKDNAELQTFAKRFDAIVTALVRQKTICKHLMDAPYLIKMLDDPIASMARVESNRKLNAKKGDVMNVGKKALNLTKEKKSRSVIRDQAATPIVASDSRKDSMVGGGMVSNNPVTYSMASSNMVPLHMAPDHTVPSMAADNRVPQNAVPQNAVPQNAVPQNMDHQNPVSQQMGPDNMVINDGAHDGTSTFPNFPIPDQIAYNMALETMDQNLCDFPLVSAGAYPFQDALQQFTGTAGEVQIKHSDSPVPVATSGPMPMHARVQSTDSRHQTPNRSRAVQSERQSFQTPIYNNEAQPYPTPVPGRSSQPTVSRSQMMASHDTPHFVRTNSNAAMMSNNSTMTPTSQPRPQRALNYQSLNPSPNHPSFMNSAQLDSQAPSNTQYDPNPSYYPVFYTDESELSRLFTSPPPAPNGGKYAQQQAMNNVDWNQTLAAADQGFSQAAQTACHREVNHRYPDPTEQQHQQPVHQRHQGLTARPGSDDTETEEAYEDESYDDGDEYVPGSQPSRKRQRQN